MELPQDWFIAWHASKGEQRLDDRIRDRVPALSRERLKEAFAAGRITVSGGPAEAAQRVAAGARIEVAVTQEDAGRYQAGARGGDGFFLLYADDDVLIVDKSAGVLTVPTDEAAATGESGEHTLVERVADVLGVAARSVIPVHRLDRFTSGVLVFARNEHARGALIDEFAAHRIVRRYLALTRGVPSPRAGTFRSRLASDARRKQHVSREGELAITHYEVAEDLRGAALVLAVLETGKRNQIRVHFAEAGWPLVGEHRYGEVPDKALSRQALHAAELELRHPRTKKPISAASPLPADMRAFYERHKLRA
jgi:23S rRNA pseudouridine1911/1915/1917 synthase